MTRPNDKALMEASTVLEERARELRASAEVDECEPGRDIQAANAKRQASEWCAQVATWLDEMRYSGELPQDDDLDALLEEGEEGEPVDGPTATAKILAEFDLAQGT